MSASRPGKWIPPARGTSEKLPQFAMMDLIRLAYFLFDC